MSRRANVVRHGANHCPGGSDPIPCWPDWFPAEAGVVYGDYVTSFSSLVAYWRLGETDEPFADTSGYSGGPHDLGISGSGTALTPDVTGGLPDDQDDGAVEFNHDGNTSTGGEFLTPGTSTLFTNLGTMTVAAFVKTDASAVSRRGTIAGCLADISGDDKGWALELVYPSRVVRFARDETYATSPGSLVAGQWYHVAATYDGTNSKLYLNGVLVATTADAVPNVGVGSEFLRIGGGYNVSPGSWLVGVIDEVAVWNEPLTAAEIALLASAATAPPEAEEGQVPTSDGTGSSTWAYPTVKVDGTRYDEILAGTGLTATDNADGTVTLAAAISGPSADTEVWMPLTTVVGGTPELVWDADDSLIPTLTPI